MIYGKWTECLWGVDPGAHESSQKRDRRGDQLSRSQPVRRCPPRRRRGGGGAGQGFQLLERVLGTSLPCWLRERKAACLDADGAGVGLHVECAQLRRPLSSAGWGSLVPPHPPQPVRIHVHLRFSLGTLCSGCFFIHPLSSCTLFA